MFRTEENIWRKILNSTLIFSKTKAPPEAFARAGYWLHITYHLAPYLDPFEAYLIPIKGSKIVSIYKNWLLNVAVNSGYLQSGPKAIKFGQKLSQKTIWLKKLTMQYSTIFEVSKVVSIYQKNHCTMGKQ